MGKLWCLAEVARELGVCERTARRWADGIGFLPHPVRMGGKRYWDSDELRDYLKFKRMNLGDLFATASGMEKSAGIREDLDISNAVQKGKRRGGKGWHLQQVALSA